MNLKLCAYVSIIVITIYGCSETIERPAQPTATPTRAPSRTPTPAPTPTPTPEPAPEPAGFPLDPDLRTDAVVGEPGSRRVVAGGGATVREASIDWQTGDDPLANQFGRNCRVHTEYEGGEPAVDWYVPAGTPVYATMDGTATLYINTIANAFDYYGVDREPYLGNPDRSRAPIAPFPGVSGGMGVWVSIESARYRADYGHLDLDASATIVPDVFFGIDYRTIYAAPRAGAPDAVVASLEVRRGDVIGYTGDAGYSEAPHLHYQIVRLSDGAQLCPTSEEGFADGGWLER